jgi:hypothetical protein
MRDCGDGMFGDQPQDERGIARIAPDEDRAGGHRRSKARREIVEDDHLLARVDEFEHHMAADVAGTAGHQDGHSRLLANDPGLRPRIVPKRVKLS